MMMMMMMMVIMIMMMMMMMMKNIITTFHRLHVPEKGGEQWQKHMGVIQNYGTRKLPLRRAFANLSRPFAPQQNRDMGLWSGFRVQIRHKDLQEDCI